MPLQQGKRMQISNEKIKMIPLIEVLCEFNKCSIQDLDSVLKNNYIKNRNFVQSLCLYTTHLHPEDRNLHICGIFITHRAANNLMAFKGQFGTTVHKYYYLRHRHRLEYPHLPCVAVEGGGEHLYYYPLEVLAVNKENVHQWVLDE